MNKYLIGTGYVERAKTPIFPGQFFRAVWLPNVFRQGVRPARVAVVCNGEMQPSGAGYPDLVDLVHCPGNLGHIQDKDEGRSRYALVGWSSAMLAAALIAYNSECDFIYQEQDCLGFGDYIGQLYRDLGTSAHAAVGGPICRGGSRFRTSQSLFIVRHAYIWSFVRDYLMEGEDLSTNSPQANGCWPEVKFSRMIQKYPDRYIYQSPGWNMDRNRPLPWGQPIWAAQQWTLTTFP